MLARRIAFSTRWMRVASAHFSTAGSPLGDRLGDGGGSMGKPGAKEAGKDLRIDAHIIMIPLPSGPVPTPMLQVGRRASVLAIVASISSGIVTAVSDQN